MKKERIKYLLEQYVNKNLTEDEKTELNQWYKSFDGKNDDINLGYFKENSTQAGNRIYKKILSKINGRRNRTNFRRWAAAVLLLITTSSALYYITHTVLYDEIIMATNKTVTVPEGKIEILNLPDGSKVWLRSGSTLTYNKYFLGNKRNIELKGEAFFEVEKNPDKPFVVHSGSMKTTVLGTSFNVRALQQLDIYDVMVRTGKVQVSDSTEVLANLLPFDRITVKNNQKLLSKTNLNNYLNWREGELVFENSRMDEIKWYLENRFNIHIEFENEKMKNCHFSGDFTGLSLGEILKIMQEVHPFAVKHINDHNLVISSDLACEEN